MQKYTWQIYVIWTSHVAFRVIWISVVLSYIIIEIANNCAFLRYSELHENIRFHTNCFQRLQAYDSETLGKYDHKNNNNIICYRNFIAKRLTLCIFTCFTFDILNIWCSSKLNLHYCPSLFGDVIRVRKPKLSNKIK